MPIIIAVAVILVTVAVLLSTRGLIYDKVDCPPEITYGNDIPYSAGAFMGSVEYEYRAEDGAWTSEKPRHVGKYYVRAVSRRIDGSPHYGSVYAFTVKPRTVEVTVNGASVYGDNPGVNAELVYGDTIECTKYVYGDLSLTSTTVSADVEGIKVTSADGEDVTRDYEFDTIEGNIVFSKRSIGITVADRTEVYNGEKVFYGGYELTSGTLADGDGIVAVADTSVTEVGWAEVEPQFRVLNVSGADVTANYAITQNKGKITVTQRIINIITSDLVAIYNGEEFSAPTYTLGEDSSLVNGHSLTVAMQTKTAAVGEEDNLLVLRAFAGETEVTSNYSFVFTYGKIKVKPRPIKVTTSSDKFRYDGKTHTLVSIDEVAFDETRVGEDVTAEYDGSNPFVFEHELVLPEASDAASIKNHSDGVVQNIFAVTVADGKTDVTDCYDIDYEYGTLEVEQITLRYTTGGGEKIYDGNPLVNPEVNIVNDGDVVSGEIIVPTALGSITKPGTADNPAEFAVKEFADGEDGADLTAYDNYKFVADGEDAIGTLAVTKRPVTVAPQDIKKVYDAAAVELNEFVVKSELGVADGETATVTYGLKLAADDEQCSTEPFIDVGVRVSEIISFTVKHTETDADGNKTETDVTDCYDLDYTQGAAEIVKRPLLVTTNSNNWVYDGERHCDSGFTPAFDETRVPSGATYDSVATAVGGQMFDTPSAGDLPDITDYVEAGVSNEFAVRVIEIDDDGKETADKSGNYDIIYDPGTLKIVKRPITLTTASHKWVYDGKEHTYGHIVGEAFDGERAPEWYTPSGSESAIVSGQEIVLPSVDSLPSITDYSASGVSNDFQVRIEAGGVDKTANYDIKYDKGLLEIAKRPITVTTATTTWVYDGDRHTDSATTETLDIVRIEEGADYSENPTEAVVSEQSLVKPSDFYLPSITDYVEGGVSNDYAVRIKKNGTSEYTESNYDIEYDKGTLKIEKRHIVVTTATDSWEYDGAEHKNSGIASTALDNEWTVPNGVLNLNTTDALVKRHTVSADGDTPGITYYAQNDVENDFAVKVMLGSAEKTNNYSIKVVPGKLSITTRQITVRPVGVKKVYDGDALMPTEYEITSTAKLASGDNVTVTYGLKVTAEDSEYVSEPFTDVGKLVGVIKVFTVKHTGIDADGNTVETDCTDSYDITFDVCDMEIVARPIKLTTASQKWVYDGERHTDGRIVKQAFDLTRVQSGAQVADESVSVVTGQDIVVPADDRLPSITDYSAGGVSNNFEVQIKAGDVDKTSNYAIEYDKGLLEITKRPITLTTASYDEVYDGQEHTAGSIVQEVYRESDLPTDVTKSAYKGAVISGHVYVPQAPLPNVKNHADGTVDNIFAVKIVDGTLASDNDRTGNYDIKYEYGTLHVRQIVLTYKSESAEKYYDGNALTESGVAIKNAADVVPGERVELKTTGTITYPGSVENPAVIERVVLVSANADITADDNYVIAETGNTVGTLTVKKVVVKISTGSAEQVYNDKPLTKNESSYSVLASNDGKLPAGHKLVITVTGTITDYVSGGVDNTATVKVTDAAGQTMTDSNGNDITDTCFTFEYDLGKLTIIKRKITVTTADGEWVFDGAEHSAPEYKIAPSTMTADGGLVTGHTHKIAVEKKITHVNESGFNVFAIVVNSPSRDNKDVTINYEIKYNYGEIKITPLAVSFHSASGQWFYDGKPHSKPEATLNDGSNELAAGHSVVVLDATTITEVGTKKNTLGINIIDESGTSRKSDYDITIDYGTLEVKRSITGGGGTNPDLIWDSIPSPSPNPPSGGEQEKHAIVQIKSDYKGTIYLRKKNDGAYRYDKSNRLFYDASPYTGTFAYNGNNYGMRQLTTLALMSGTHYDLDIKIVNPGAADLVPDYVSRDVATKNDVSDEGMALGDEYSLTFYPYEFMSDGGASLKLPASVTAAERTYAAYVRSTYLDIPDATKAYMQELAADNGFDSADPAKFITQIVKYIRKAARYERNYDPALDTETDVAVAFLKKYKQGICQHFATSATMMLRAHGIPARFCSGVSAKSKGSGTWEDVDAANMHAWTEAYIDGVGWVRVDATAGGPGGGGGEDPSEPDDPDDPSGNKDAKYIIKPIDIYAESNPESKNVLVGVNDALRQALLEGWSYNSTVGTRTRNGVKESYVTTFRLLDDKGKTVYNYSNLSGTSVESLGDDYKDSALSFAFRPGKLVETGKPIVRITPNSVSAQYDGKPHSIGSRQMTVKLPDELVSRGYSLELSSYLGVSAIDAGCENIESLRAAAEKLVSWYTVYDGNGANVTDAFNAQYYPLIDFGLTETDYAKLKKDLSPIGVVTVNAIKLTARSISLSKKYDGTPLTVDSWLAANPAVPRDMIATITSGEVLDGHIVAFEFTGEVIDIGFTYNDFIVVITDENGKDVSRNYKVNGIAGMLTVTE